MAVAYVVRVSDLLPEFLTYALVFFGAFHTAGAIAAGTCQPFPNHFYHFFIFIEPYCHRATSFLRRLYHNSKGRVKPSPTQLIYFLRKDMQSVHWSMVGLHSWVPTRILSREQ